MILVLAIIRLLRNFIDTQISIIKLRIKIFRIYSTKEKLRKDLIECSAENKKTKLRDLIKRLEVLETTAKYLLQKDLQSRRSIINFAKEKLFKK